MAENSEIVRRRRGRRRGRRLVVPRPGATLSHLVKQGLAGFYEGGVIFKVVPGLGATNLLLLLLLLLLLPVSEFWSFYTFSILPFF
jgi:hypothetical protein